MMLGGGCGKDLAIEDFARLEKGMSAQEVAEIMGEGKEIAWSKVEGQLSNFPEIELTEESCDRWLQWGNGAGLGLVGFEDGRVKEIFKH